MKRKIAAGVIGVLFLSVVGSGVPLTQIKYEASEVGESRWQYEYEISNVIMTGPIEEVTIWFDYGLFDNLAVETIGPPGWEWDEIVVQPEPIIGDDGYYDALALGGGIEQGQTVVGFAVSFDWLGVGEPRPQFYEIIDPATFEAIDSGFTVPEPSIVLLLGLGILALPKRQKRDEK